MVRFFRRKQRSPRKVFGFLCDPDLMLGAKLLAHHLEVPIYPLAEHVMELGLQELVAVLTDKTLKERLRRHLLQDHLLVMGLPPEHKAVSQRADRLRNCLELLRLYEVVDVPAHEIAEALDALAARARARRAGDA